MTDGDALLAAIIANPDDDTPRLIYADWLQENGDEDRAEFIRLQLERAQFSPSRWVAPVLTSDNRIRYQQLRRRESDLLGRHRKDWLRPFKALMPGGSFEFTHGFVEEVITEASVYWRSAEELYRIAPIHYVIVRNCLDMCRLNLAARPPQVRLQVMSNPGWTTRYPTGGRPPTLIDLLPQSPAGLESFVASGHWGILAWSIWSGPDRAAVARLRNAVSGANWPVGFGLRPFDEYSEFRSWCPTASEHVSPLWLQLEDGELISEHVGVNPPETVREMFTHLG